MGRDWYWGGRSSNSRRSSSFGGGEEDHHGNGHNSSLSSGCMNAVFQFFDFHPSHFTANSVFNKQQPQQQRHQQQQQQEHSSKGVEAPRNSLELDGDSSLSYWGKESFGIPMELKKIKTRSSNSGKRSKEIEKGPVDHRFSAESPGAKTPNLVARLMGLEILPQSPNLQFRHGRPKQAADYSVAGTRSLPDSPRSSAARKSDADRHHRRLSLQINLHKENAEISEGIEQGKERIRRKIALNDITNTNRNLEISGEETVLRKTEKTADESSPKVRFLEAISENLNTRLSTKCAKEVIPEKPNLKKPKQKPRSFEEHQRNKRIRRFCSNPREEEEDNNEDAFSCSSIASSARKGIIDIKIDERRKKTPLSNNHFPVKKCPSPPAAKIPHEQPCNYPKGKQKHPTRSEEEEQRRTNTVNYSSTATIHSESSSSSAAAEFHYIAAILTSSKFPLHTPLDPSLFHLLENSALQNPIRLRSDRRLLFHLVDELLPGILSDSEFQGARLAEELRRKTAEFPRANCRVLADIDALIATDLRKSELRMSAAMAEREGVVELVELEIWDSLLREATAAIALVGLDGKVTASF